jgi:hypothetical protein
LRPRPAPAKSFKAAGEAARMAAIDEAMNSSVILFSSERSRLMGKKAPLWRRSMDIFVHVRIGAVSESRVGR